MEAPDSATVAYDLDEALRPVLLLASRAAASVAPRVSSSQLQALVALHRRGPMKLTSLALELGSIPSSASRMCDRLVASGFLERRAGQVDRREVFLHLTPDGDDVVRAVREVRQRALAEAIRGCTVAERQALLLGLRAFAAQLED